MNYIYLMRDEKRHFCLFKVGFTKNLQDRIYQYTTHNPLAECISFLRTREESKRTIEKAFHDEVERMGYEFIYAVIDNKLTEWFKIDYNDPFYEKLCEKGLTAFRNGRNRKDYGIYTKSKG